MQSRLRPDNNPPVQLLGQALGEMFAAIITRIGHDEIFRTCASCNHWQEGGENHLGEPTGCKLYKQLPPVKVIVNGCDKHSDVIEVPF